MLPIIKPEISRCVLFSFGLFLEKQREKGMLSNSNVCVSIPGKHVTNVCAERHIPSVCEGSQTLPVCVKEERCYQCMWRKPDSGSVCEGSQTLPVYVKEARRYQCVWRKQDVTSYVKEARLGQSYYLNFHLLLSDSIFFTSTKASIVKLNNVFLFIHLFAY